MRKDTTLVFVDVPGLNEADSKMMYLNYVKKKWDTFDCVIIVMDADRGVNAEEQVELLNFVKVQLDREKNIPVLVLCNKVDDPDDDELMELVGEVQGKVEQIFNVGSRTESLKQVLSAFSQGKRCNNESSVYPIFIPLSAGNAFAYRVAANRSFDKFRQLDPKLIDKLGRDEVGKFKWKKLSPKEKYKVTFSALSDSKQYEEHLEVTNFDKFLSALAYSIGGNDVQRQLLGKQVEVSLRKLSVGSIIAAQLRFIYYRCKSIDRDPMHLKDAFWITFDKLLNQAVLTVTVSSHVDARVLANPIGQLIAYNDFVCEVGWNDQQAKIADQMRAEVRQQLALVLKKEQEWKIDGAAIVRYIGRWSSGFSRNPENFFPWDWQLETDGWRNIHTRQWIEGADNPSKVIVTWKTLTYHDWATIFGSLLLMASNQHVCEQFGREKLLLEQHLQRYMYYANCLTNGQTTKEIIALSNISDFSKGRYVDGTFVPCDRQKYDLVAQIIAPQLISDPSHWGHVIWKYCKFMDKATSMK